MHGGPPTRHLQSQQRPLSFVDRQSSISGRKLNLASPERVCHPAHKNSSVSAKTTDSRRWAICIVSTSAPGQPPKMHDMPPTKLLSLNKGAQSLVVGQSEVFTGTWSAPENAWRPANKAPSVSATTTELCCQAVRSLQQEIKPGIPRESKLYPAHKKPSVSAKTTESCRS